MAGPVYEFGGFRLDCGRFELSREGSSIPLERIAPASHATNR